MRIAAISNSRIPSETANSIQAMKVCDALVQVGHDVHLIVPAEAPTSSWDELASHYGVKHRFSIQRLPSHRVLRRLDFVWYAHASTRKLGGDLVYTWLPQAAALEARLGIPVILEMHADVAGSFGAWWLRRFWAGDGPKRLLVTTDALRTALERSAGLAFPDASVLVAPNGVDLDRYAQLPEPADAREQLGLPARLTVGFTGHFYPGRGVDLLFELAKALPDLHFLWVGGLQNAVEFWRRKLTEAQVSNVTLTGFIENSRLPLYQAAADILTMPYGRQVAASSGQDIAEIISPMKMFEYMAAGRAIVTADLPAIREVLDESRAVFCPPGHPMAWRRALVELSSDVNLRARLSQNARREALKHTWFARAEAALRGLDAV